MPVGAFSNNALNVMLTNQDISSYPDKNCPSVYKYTCSFFNTFRPSTSELNFEMPPVGKPSERALNERQNTALVIPAVDTGRLLSV